MGATICPTSDKRCPNATGAGTTLADLEQLLAMGMEEGLREAMCQIDAVLADLASFASGGGTSTQILSDTQARISRGIRGTAEQVWRAHHEPELMQRWMLGPDGWTMPVCEVATSGYGPVPLGAAGGLDLSIRHKESLHAAPTARWFEWVRQGEPRRLDHPELKAFAAGLERLKPPRDDGYACTEELGPCPVTRLSPARWMGFCSGQPES